MKNITLVLVVLSASVTAATAGPTADKKVRDAVNQSLAEGAAEAKDCGKTLKFSFDWAAFDKLDWSKASRPKEDQAGFEISNVRWVGKGINYLCEDKDYKESLQKIDNVVYRTTPDSEGASGPRVTAKVQGKTLTFDSRMGGSTRDPDSFTEAAKQVF